MKLLINIFLFVGLNAHAQLSDSATISNKREADLYAELVFQPDGEGNRLFLSPPVNTNVSLKITCIVHYPVVLISLINYQLISEIIIADPVLMTLEHQLFFLLPGEYRVKKAGNEDYAMIEFEIPGYFELR